MLGANYFQIPTLYTLGLILAALAASLLLGKRKRGCANYSAP
jgi:LPXTG-motif cell wall-anchored protein